MKILLAPNIIKFGHMLKIYSTSVLMSPRIIIYLQCVQWLVNIYKLFVLYTIVLRHSTLYKLILCTYYLPTNIVSFTFYII